MCMMKRRKDGCWGVIIKKLVFINCSDELYFLGEPCLSLPFIVCVSVWHCIPYFISNLDAKFNSPL